MRTRRAGQAQTVTLNPLRLMPSSRPLKETPMSSLKQFPSKSSRSRDASRRSPSRSVLVGIGSRRPRQRLIGLAGIALAPAVIAKDRHDDARWVGTWSASPQAVAAPIQINGQTVRQIVHTSIGGERVRVRFSNAYGTSGPGHRLRARGHQHWWRIDFQQDRSGTQVQWITHHHHSRRCVGGERPRNARRAGTRRSRRQSLPAGERGRDDPACAGPANDLHLVSGRLHGREHRGGDHHHSPSTS